MIKTERLTLDKQELFKSYYKNMRESIYNFTNLFMWAMYDRITYIETNGFIVPIFQHALTPPSALFPVGAGDFKKAVHTVGEYLKSRGCTPVFRQLSAEMKKKLESAFPGSFEFIPNRDSSDYIYETAKMISHSGKKLHSKKNHLNYFRNNYDFTYSPITEDDIEDCRSLFLRWQGSKDTGDKFIDDSIEATNRILDNYAALGVRGGCIRVGGELAAFSIGEQTCPDMALIHLEVASGELRGAFNIINQQFCEHEWSELSYVNREEDMGLAGLRQAKLAYAPCEISECYNAVETGNF